MAHAFIEAEVYGKPAAFAKPIQWHGLVFSRGKWDTMIWDNDMPYTIANIPRELEEALRRRASDQGKSLDQVAVEALSAGLGINGAKQRELGDLAGTWVEDPQFDRIIREQDQVDPDLWK